MPAPPAHRSHSQNILPAHRSNVDHVLEHLRKGGKLRKKDNHLWPYLNATRWVPLSIDPFICFTWIFHAGIYQEPENPSNEPFTDEDHAMFDCIIMLVPTFPKLIKSFESDPDLFDVFIKQLSSAAATARQEDTAALKNRILGYIHLDMLNGVLKPPLTSAHAKSLRGFNHPEIARLLCPIKQLGEFDADPNAFMDQVKDGQIKIKAKDWPAFVYSADGEFDPEDVSNGLMRGYVGIHAFCCIFTGPSSVVTGHCQATKLSKVQAHGLTQATGRTIAYAFVQVRMALCASSEWSQHDDYFDHGAFFNISLASSRLTPWIHGLLRPWSGSPSSQSQPSPTEEKEA
ncbi:hypothetical protein BDQ12DRAFT_723616 [Crucibulum laeve]|uniref:Uncharacterized protein n=1 Tax=Crucibulum laeve TaxID=68775 RepID=A0A5C3LZA3_9AGAR|nr:hypothetical protein BDQ12DRAFT_723616 [Crucibulum laeve]